MENFTSSQIDFESDVYRSKYQHNKGNGIKKVNDSMIISKDVSNARGRAELLDNGYKKRFITIKSIHIVGLKQNDIIKFKGENWIVKEINLNYTPPTLTSTIKGMRYE